MSYSKHVTYKKKTNSFPILPFTNGSCGSSILLQNNLKTESITSTTDSRIIPKELINSSTTQTFYLSNYDNNEYTLENHSIKKLDHIKNEYINVINQNVITINAVENVKCESVIEDNQNGEIIHLLSGNDGNVYCVTIDEFENHSNNLIMPEEELQIQSNDDSIDENSNLDITIEETELIKNERVIEDVDLESISEVVEALKCKWCSFTTLSKESLLIHRKECHSQKVDTSKNYYMNVGKDKVMYICGRCSKTLPSVEDCRNHMINDHQLQLIVPDDKNLDSDKQDETSSPENSKMNSTKKCLKTPAISKMEKEYWLTPMTVQEARYKLKGNLPIRCLNSPCLFRFKSIDLMEVHRACHTKSTLAVQKSYQRSPLKTPALPYLCTLCDANFNNWPSCSLHLWREHSMCVDLVTCPLCFTVKTHSISKMIQHIARHWRNQLSDPKISSPNDITDLPRWYSTIKCEICEKMFSDCKALKKHVQAVHKKIKPFICNVCNHSATTKQTMQLHMRQHTGEKPYACKFCTYRTGDHNTLRKHHMKHTGERPYKCSRCAYSCIQSVALKHHLRKHH